MAAMNRIYRIKKRQLHHGGHEVNEGNPGNAALRSGIIDFVVLADDEMQAFSLHHLVEAGETTALLNDSAQFVIAVTVPAQGFIELGRARRFAFSWLLLNPISAATTCSLK